MSVCLVNVHSDELHGKKSRLAVAFSLDTFNCLRYLSVNNLPFSAPSEMFMFVFQQHLSLFVIIQ